MDRLIKTLRARIMRLFFRHLYTTFAWAYDFVSWSSSMGQWRTWQHTALIDLPEGRLLEVGHGPGHLLLDLCRLGREVYGVDASRQMAWMAKDRLKRDTGLNINVCGRAQALPFLSSTFAGVIATFPSEYVLDPEALKSIYRVLHTGGCFVIVGVAEITGTALYDRFAAWLYRIAGQTRTSVEPLASWLDDLERYGFAANVEVVPLPRARVTRVIASKITMEESE